MEAQTHNDPDVTTVVYDSRAAAPGSLFVAVRGQNLDGNTFVGDAISAGAAVVVSERASFERGVSWIRVSDARRALAQFSCSVYGHPSRQVMLVGITGTNGKTTTAFLVEAILKKHFGAAGLMGTVMSRMQDVEIRWEKTTPESPEINAFLAQALASGVRATVMEVSSHALELKRVEGLQFCVAVFTNLTRDHLDFHHTFENYFAAKKKLFFPKREPVPVAVVNLDDPWGQQLKAELKEPIVGYSLFDSAADVFAPAVEYRSTGLRLQVASRTSAFDLDSALFGRPNAYNLLAASAVGVALRIPHQTIADALAGVKGVPGRFENVPSDRDFVVFVDFAHTDDALRNLLELARPLTAGRLIVVFGCGGDRDRTKRPLMGRVAGELADFSILTSDNPRSEDPRAILKEIEDGIGQTAGRYKVIVDRYSAIAEAIRMARKGDVVLLAGKGHEDYQVIAGTKLPFSDRAVAEELLRDV